MFSLRAGIRSRRRRRRAKRRNSCTPHFPRLGQRPPRRRDIHCRRACQLARERDSFAALPRGRSGGQGKHPLNMQLPPLPSARNTCWAAVAERLACSHPTKANRAQFPAKSFQIFASGNRAGRCHWSAGFLGDLRLSRPCIPALLHSHLIPPPLLRLSSIKDTMAKKLGINSQKLPPIKTANFSIFNRLAYRRQGLFEELRAASHEQEFAHMKGKAAPFRFRVLSYSMALLSTGRHVSCRRPCPNIDNMLMRGRTPLLRPSGQEPFLEAAGRYCLRLSTSRKTISKPDDNAKCHVSRATMQWYTNNNVRRMDRPTQSPYLNPMEHLWDELVRRVRARQARPTSIAQLMEWLHEEWRRITVDVLQTLVESMSDRVAAVIAARGTTDKTQPNENSRSVGVLAPVADETYAALLMPHPPNSHVVNKQLLCADGRRRRHDADTACFARRNDEALGMRVTVARIAASLLYLERAAVSPDSHFSRYDDPRSVIHLAAGSRCKVVRGESTPIYWYGGVCHSMSFFSVNNIIIIIFIVRNIATTMKAVAGNEADLSLLRTERKGRLADLWSKGRGFAPRCLRRGRLSVLLSHWEFVNRSAKLELCIPPLRAPLSFHKSSHTPVTLTTDGPHRSPTPEEVTPVGKSPRCQRLGSLCRQRPVVVGTREEYKRKTDGPRVRRRLLCHSHVNFGHQINLPSLYQPKVVPVPKYQPTTSTAPNNKEPATRDESCVRVGDGIYHWRNGLLLEHNGVFEARCGGTGLAPVGAGVWSSGHLVIRVPPYRRDYSSSPLPLSNLPQCVEGAAVVQWSDY
ncbi:hypothetical protein PR048_009565 [Dryococelus australis]|uniref:Uncharacterized protein n=1 Tax=Dryococelus australis TaxID=614101 RepID=A0ABQ9I0C5_9NEOP|nr:hypothetical protein PR048_009565 [Dryococelus australis]